MRSGSTRNLLVLQSRDIAFLRGLLECRVMTIRHVALLYFDRRQEAAKKRLQKLKRTGLVGERPRAQFQPSIIFLTRGGLQVLREQGILDLYPTFDVPSLERRARVSDLTIQHELAVLDLKVAFQSAAAAHGLSILECTTWPLLNQFTAPGGVVKPDAFVRFRSASDDNTTEEHHLFIELDQSTEPLGTLCDRSRRYAAHAKKICGQMERGVSHTGRHQHPFRVLYVLRSRERRDILAERLRTANPPILSLVWLTTFEEASNDPFGAIWLRPIDYRNPHRSGRPLLPGPAERERQPESVLVQTRKAS
ncbi:MAG TPA: replication-relaxation family protein [Opitutus sp.]|nr:replication-relaxation family protein [Opitutus sp.]